MKQLAAELSRDKWHPWVVAGLKCDRTKLRGTNGYLKEYTSAVAVIMVPEKAALPKR